MTLDYFMDFLMLILSIVLWICFDESVFLIMGAIAIVLAVCIVVIDMFEIRKNRKNGVMHGKCCSCM